MYRRRRAANQFIEMYYHGQSIPPLRRVHYVQARLQPVTTIIIDTPQLTDGTLRYSRSWSPTDSEKEVLRHASRALAKSSREANYLREALTPISTHTPSQTTKRRDIWIASYPRGEQYEHEAVGPLESVLACCDLTENERERIVLEARRYARYGNLIYAVASTTNLSSKPPRGSLVFRGLVMLRLSLFPYTKQSIQHLRALGYTLVYASTDSATLVTTVAHHTALIPPSVLPQTSVNHQLSDKSTVYAALSPSDRRRLIASYENDSVLVAQQPLPELDELLTTIRVRHDA